MMHATAAQTGVLLVNLGTPSAPQAGAIRRYLREFLSDRRVVELPRALWLPILYGFILPLRPLRLAHAYAQVWTEQGSPLLAICQRQQAALQAALPECRVALAMRYGEPSIASVLEQLRQSGVRRLLVLPLYPQYSGTTTASVMDAVFDALKTQRWMPELRSVNCYHDQPAHIAALAESVQRHWSTHGRGQHLLMSFHGIPQKYVLAGDPYFCHCQKTARLLAEALQLAPGSWSVSFQSRLGRTPWLKPYTDEVLPKLSASGVRTLDVMCPGFAADCLETLEEVSIRYREQFRAAGGESMRYIPALNDDAAQISALAALARQHLQGWPAAESAAEVGARVKRVEGFRAAD